MKRVLITGASQGVGLALCAELKKRGYSIIAVCRKMSRELKALGVQVIENVDVRDEDAINKMAVALKDESIDVLINNAGVFLSEKFGKINYDDLLEQFHVNTLGPLRVTEALSKNLAEGGKVVMISSQMGSIAMNGGGYYGYRMSKAALNSAATSLVSELKPRGISVLLIHPGYVKTRMTEWKGVTDPSDSAKGIADRIESHVLKKSGEFLGFDGVSVPW